MVYRHGLGQNKSPLLPVRANGHGLHWINYCQTKTMFRSSLIRIDIIEFRQKKRRSNVEQAESGASRKQTRYNSTNTLSGLIVCAECGANYRRITRPDGSIVWCCANRVERGKRICKHSPTISEESAIKLLGLQPAQLEPHNIVSRLPQPRHYHKGSPSCLFHPAKMHLLHTTQRHIWLAR